MATIKWWQKTCIYQVYPRSFMDSDNDGIGDIDGIIAKLDYIKDIGFETIWLSPFYSSPQQDFGYDVSDYYAISPEYGDMGKVERLIAEVHKRKMYIVFDMVLNHTSIEHAWFKESRSSRNNKKRDWYIWQDGASQNRPPNNWKATIGSSGWHYDKLTDQWYWSSFLPFQPDLNYHNPAVKKAMLDVVRYWLDKKVDGFRLDIFNSIFEDLSFEDNPLSFRLIPSENNPNGFFQELKHTVNHPLSFEFAKELRTVINEYKRPERFVIGEVFGKPDIIKQYLGEKQEGLNLIFMLETIHFKFTANFFRKRLLRYEQYYPWPYLPTYVFSNHDRIRSIYNVKNNLEKAKLLATFQLMARGVPVNYMGEEIGMRQSNLSLKEALDPVAQKYSWIPQWFINLVGPRLNRDGCRTPMQWDETVNAGFSKTKYKTWLPVNDCYKNINVKAELRDSNSLLNTFKQLIAVRKSNEAILSGQLNIVKTNHKKILSFTRVLGGETILILINFSNHKFYVEHPLPTLKKSLFIVGQAAVNGEVISMPPISAIILKG